MRDVTRRRNAQISNFEAGSTARDDESQFASWRGDGASGTFGTVLGRMRSGPQDAEAPQHAARPCLAMIVAILRPILALTQMEPERVRRT